MGKGLTRSLANAVFGNRDFSDTVVASAGYGGIKLPLSEWVSRVASPGPVFAIFGTSITAQNSRNAIPPEASPARAWFSDGYATWLRILSKQQINLPVHYNFGVSGNTLAQMLARISAVIAVKPDYCIVEGGTNDFVPTTFEAARDTWVSIVTTLRANGITPIILPAPPRGDGVLTAAQIRKQQRFYNFQREFCLSRRGYMFADYIGSWADQTSASSVPLAGRTRTDNIHPATTGAYYMGKAIWDLISPLLPTRPTHLLTKADTYNASDNPTGNLLRIGTTNLGTMEGTGGVQAANAGLTYAGTGLGASQYFSRTAATSTCTVTLDKQNPRTDAGRMSGERQLIQIAANAGGGADEVYSLLYTMSLADFTTGDWYYAEAAIEIITAPANVNALELYLIETRPSNSQAAMDLGLNVGSGGLPAVLWNGVLRTPPIPKQADSTAVQLYIRARLNSAAGAASIKFAVADVVVRKVDATLV